MEPQQRANAATWKFGAKVSEQRQHFWYAAGNIRKGGAGSCTASAVRKRAGSQRAVAVREPQGFVNRV